MRRKYEIFLIRHTSASSMERPVLPLRPASGIGCGLVRRLQMRMRLRAAARSDAFLMAMTLVHFDTDQIELAVMHAALGADDIGQLFHGGSSALQEHRLEAVLVIQ